MFYTRFETPFCEIILVGDELGLRHLHLNTGLGKRQFSVAEEWVENAVFFADTRRQIDEYFGGTRTEFEVVLNPQGTEYQKRVWLELVKIPSGVVCTYKDVAIRVGNMNSSRAVGLANSKNPIPLIIPCHRVIGSNGKLTGFAHGLEIKERLLGFEASRADL